jgi:hypothetical protein
MGDEMKKVWIVTDGCYSDYKIVAVFSEQETAEICAKAQGPDGRAEEWDLDTGAEQYRQGLVRWYVGIYADGATWMAQVGEAGRDGFYVRPNAKTGLVTSMWAKDKEHAVKIANERRAFYVANNLWGQREKVVEW